MPTPLAAGTPGWYANSGTATSTTADWANAVQAELLAILSYAGITPSKTATNQVLTGILSIISSAVPRTRLSANLTLYVATSGSDTTGTGTSGAPFATIQHAINVLYQNYDLAGYSATISVGAGTFTGGSFNGQAFGQTSPIVVNGAGASSTTISYSTSNSAAFNAQGYAWVQVQNMTINATNSICVNSALGAVVNVCNLTLTASGSPSSYQSYGAALAAGDAGVLQMVQGSGSNSGISFGTCGWAHIAAGGGGVFSSNGYAYAITGSAPSHVNVFQQGQAVNTNSVVTISNTPAFSSAFVTVSDSLATMYSSSYGGSATGTRYNVSLNGAVNTNGAGASFLPGSIAGATATGGQYV